MSKYCLIWEDEESGVGDLIGYYSTLSSARDAMISAIKENKHLKYHVVGGKRELHYDPNED